MSKKTKDEIEEAPEQEEETVTDPEPAPAAVQQPVYTPPQKTSERFAGSDGAPRARRYPRIFAGTCESCGVIDSTKPGKIQYTLCPHFRDLGELACSYCDPTVDPVESIGAKVTMVSDHPHDPSKVIAWCTNGPGNVGSDCEEKHLKRFTPSRV